MTTNAGYSLECQYRVYNDTTGEYVQVGPDRDSLGLTEIRPGPASTNTSILVETSTLPLLIVALQKRLADIEGGAA